MFTPDLASVEFRESVDLPANTLVAPISVIREIRLVLGSIGIDMQVGVEEAVLVSSDLFSAFGQWDEARIEEEESDGPDEDTSWLN